MTTMITTTTMITMTTMTTMTTTITMTTMTIMTIMTTLIRALLPTSTVISARNRWIRVCASIPTTRATSRIQQMTPTNGDLSTRLAELCPNRGLHTATTTAKSSASPTRRAIVTDVTTADGVGHQTIQRS